jgi:hypothetical protein
MKCRLVALHRGTSKNLKIAVISAQAGIHSTARSMSYEGLGPSLRWDDAVFIDPATKHE